MRQKIEITSDIKKGIMTLKYTKNDQGEFVCPDCGVTKKNQNTMHYHMKKHEEQLAHICKDCKKGFLQKQTLDLHIRSKHPGKEPDKKFNCTFDNCEFTAITKGNCVIHYLRVHYQDEINNIMVKDGNVFYCNECNEEFNSSCAFYYHCKGCIEFEKDDKYKKFKDLTKPTVATVAKPKVATVEKQVS